MRYDQRKRDQRRPSSLPPRHRNPEYRNHIRSRRLEQRWLRRRIRIGRRVYNCSSPKWYWSRDVSYMSSSMLKDLTRQLCLPIHILLLSLQVQAEWFGLGIPELRLVGLNKKEGEFVYIINSSLVVIVRYHIYARAVLNTIFTSSCIPHYIFGTALVLMAGTGLNDCLDCRLSAQRYRAWNIETLRRGML